MNSRDRKLNRRSLLRYSLWGGAGLIGSNAFMNAGRIFNSSQSILQNGLPLDTISLLENALRGGRALFNFEQANAASNDFYLITISCYNSLNSRFLCGAGEIDSTTRNLTAETSVLGNCTDTKAYLEANGVNKVHSNEVFQKLRLTEWWGNMLLNGTMDGKLPAETNVVSGTLKYISPFLSTETSLQIALGMETTSVHSFQNLRLANKDINGLGDLNYYAQSRHQLSPFGITCLDNGRTVSSAAYNAVVDDKGGLAVEPVRLVDFVNRLEQSLSSGYQPTSTQSLEGMFLGTLDGLSNFKDIATMRKTQESALETIRKKIPVFGSLIPMTTQRTPYNLAMGTIALSEPDVGAPVGFLAQCSFVAEMLDGMDLCKNYNLFINTSDLNTNVFDMPTSILPSLPKGYAIHTVEAARQLAIGFNILATAIQKTQKKVIVVFGCDTGRGIKGADTSSTFAAILASKSFNLANHLYTNDNEFKRSGGSISADPDGLPFAWGKDLVQADGTEANNYAPSIENFNNGVAKFLFGENPAGGRYVNLKKNS